MSYIHDTDILDLQNHLDHYIKKYTRKPKHESINKNSPQHKELGLFIIHICPTYNNEKYIRRIISEINMYCMYIILTIWKHDNFCWMTTAFIEKKLIEGYLLCMIHCN